MKKTKILIPALGMMMLSTAAAVSGTMAWFTATRSITVSTTDFAVESLDGALTAVSNNLCGTNAPATSAAGTTSAVSLATNVKLCDSSFNHANGELFTDVIGNDDVQTGHVKVGDLDDLTGSNTTAWSVNGTTTYYAAAFQITFTYTFKGDTTARHLFFDTNLSSSEAEKQVGDYGENDHWRTSRGFRIALINDDENDQQQIVWAPQRGSADKYYVDGGAGDTDVTYSYVTGNALDALGTYNVTKDAAAQSLLCSQTTNNKLSTYAGDNPNADTDHTNRFDYLGTITNTSGSGLLTIKVVAWFEGTDPEVINKSTMDQVSTTMKFYVRTAHAA